MTRKAKKPAGGRPSKLTPALEKEIVGYLEGGNFREVAAELAGVDKATMRRWVQRGRREPSGLWGSFARRVREAERRAEANMLRIVVLGAAEDPKHAEWFLERKFPERWGRKDSVKAELAGRVSFDGLADLLRMGHDDDDDAEAPEPKDAGKGEDAP